MADLTPERPEVAATGKTQQRALECAALPHIESPVGAQEETEERRLLLRKIRRREFARKLAKFGTVCVFLFVGYVLVKWGASQQRFREFMLQPMPWWVSLLLGAPATLLLFFFPWLTVFKLRNNPRQRRQAWTATLIWALVLLAIVLAVELGKWPDCSVGDCIPEP
jgi:hypothetical protein